MSDDSHHPSVQIVKMAKYPRGQLQVECLEGRVCLETLVRYAWHWSLAAQIYSML